MTVPVMQLARPRVANAVDFAQTSTVRTVTNRKLPRTTLSKHTLLDQQKPLTQQQQHLLMLGQNQKPLSKGIVPGDQQTSANANWNCKMILLESKIDQAILENRRAQERLDNLATWSQKVYLKMFQQLNQISALLMGPTARDDADGEVDLV